MFLSVGLQPCPLASHNAGTEQGNNSLESWRRVYSSSSPLKNFSTAMGRRAVRIGDCYITLLNDYKVMIQKRSELNGLGSLFQLHNFVF